MGAMMAAVHFADGGRYSREPDQGYAQESDILRNIENQRLQQLQSKLDVKVSAC